MRDCVVVGCRNSGPKRRKDLQCFYFPKNKLYRTIWKTFSRRGSEFEPRDHTSICEEHFHASCLSFKKKRYALLPNSVPTIFKRHTPEGEETVVVTFDYAVCHYLEEDTLLNPTYDKEQYENMLAQKKAQRLKEIGKLCRFCFSEDLSESELIAIGKLNDYSVKPDEAFALVGITNKPQANVFSDVICEECFQNIVSFDGFKKRCCKAETLIISELKDLDVDIQKCSELAVNQDPWNEPEDSLEDVEKSNESFDMAKAEPEFHSIVIKTEAEDVPDLDEYQIQSFGFDDRDDDSDNEIPDETPAQEVAVTITENQEIEEKPENGENKDESNVKAVGSSIWDKEKTDRFGVNTSSIRNQDRQPLAKNVYQCLFCGLSYPGRLTFKKHNCQVKELRCPDSGCDKIFRKQSGYNSHITMIHKLPRLTRRMCVNCRVSMVTTDDEFKQHGRQCEMKKEKRTSKAKIKCPACDRMCANTQSLTIHMMFHKNDDPKVLASDAQARKERKRRVCDACGKEFATPKYLNDHIKRMHKVIENPQVFTCDHCGKTRNNRQLLRKHIRNVHVLDSMDCKICGKSFKNKPMWQAHTNVYHRDEKRIHFCTLCPDRQPYATGVALRRHQESNHGYGPGYQCDVCGTVMTTNKGLIAHRRSVHKIQNSS